MSLWTSTSGKNTNNVLILMSL
uniref:Uncharacterized protein n=1 Tax=Anguilla anguilla TaxID=7936 RepID=A0A0E9VWD1_ANGAN